MFEQITITLPAGMTFEQFDRAARREFWHARLREANGSIRRAARLAGCPRTTAHDQLRRLGLNARDFRTP